jgi:PleD family two-component response regulator
MPVLTSRSNRSSILLVDPQDLHRRATRRLLQMMYTVPVIEADEAERALHVLDGTVICVIAALEMPTMSGLRLCWTIRNAVTFRPWRDVPVILVSSPGDPGFDDYDQQASACDAGTALILHRPIAPWQLVQMFSGVTGLTPRNGQPSPRRFGTLPALPPSYRRV